MSSDPNQYLQEQRHQQQQAREARSKATLEVVGIERQKSGLLPWQMTLARIGGFIIGALIVYLVLNAIF